MGYVFLLQHSYELDEVEQTKIIGVYSTKYKAQIVIEEYKKLPGFKDYPNSFFIDEYIIDDNNWSDGFISWDKAY